MYELRIDQIQILDELQSRASTDWKHVDELVELLQSGGQFKDHPVVFRQRPDGDEYFLADGFHRVHAYLKAGIESAMFDVRAGGTTAFRLAKLWSIQSNITHGLKRSNADKRRAVEMLLADEEWSSKSDRWIAETAGVHHSTVQAIKQVAESANPVISGSVIPEFRTGVDGKQYQAKKSSQPIQKADPDLISLTDDQTRRLSLARQGYSQLANQHTDSALIKAAQDEGIYCRIDRNSIWGNPFILDEDGDRETVIENYADYLTKRPSLRKMNATLRGRILGCWCYPEPCHGHILMKEFDI